MRATIHPDDLADVQAAYAGTLAEGGPVDTQTRYPHRDGRWRTLLTRRVLMRDGQGQPAMILGVALDVTEHEQRTTEALQLASRLDAAADAARVGLWSSPLDGRPPQWNGHMHVLLRRDPAQGAASLGDALREYALAADRERVAALVLAWTHGHECPRLEFELRVQRSDGAMRWMQIRALCEVDAGGSQRAFGVMQDITGQREATERLRVANERTSLALSAVSMGTWAYDAASAIDDWDEQMFLLRGLPPSATVPTREQRLALVLPEDRQIADTRAMAFTSGAEPLDYEFRIRRANDGAVRTLASRSIALTDARPRHTPHRHQLGRGRGAPGRARAARTRAGIAPEPQQVDPVRPHQPRAAHAAQCRARIHTVDAVRKRTVQCGGARAAPAPDSDGRQAAAAAGRQCARAERTGRGHD